MAHANYIHRILHRPASRARVLLNGVPLYDRAPDRNVSPMAPVTHWLVPGENAVLIELHPAPQDPRQPDQGPHFAMQIVGADDEAVRYAWEFPDSVSAAGLEPKLPWLETGFFVIGGDLPEPIYLRAPREEFPIEGTPSQRRAVEELHDAFASRDAARFEDAMDLKFSEFDRYYGPRPAARADAVQRMNAPWIMEPFDPEDLRFERYLDGRVAYVRRASGRPAVRAVHRDEPYLGWGADFFMTQVGGRWRIFW